MKKPPKVYDCSECGAPCVTGRARKTCSPDCTRARRNRLLREAYAQDPDRERERIAAYRATMTDEQVEIQRQMTRERMRAAGYTEAKRQRDHKRRALKAGATVESFTAREIYERDAWTCGICESPIDRSLKFPDPASVSLDHIQPLSLGGAHSRANTRASHLDCNVRRGNRVA